MRPHTLLAFVVFLVLWGADDSLGAAWLPSGGRHASHHQEFFPLSLRHREQIYRNIRTTAFRAASRSSRTPAPAVEGRRTREEAGQEPHAPDTLYAFMSLQL